MMKKRGRAIYQAWRPVVFAALFAVLSAQCTDVLNRPIEVSADNPHYFSYHGKPLRIFGTYTHDVFSCAPWVSEDVFHRDYKRFIDGLACNGVTGSRVWINWAGECYARTGTGHANDRKPAYDLTRFSKKYLARLKDFVGYAQDKGVILQLVLFDGWLIKDADRYATYHAYSGGNNVNGIDLKNADFGRYPNLAMQYQDDFVRKVVDVLNEYDNWYFETKNEGGTFHGDWVEHIIKVIREREATKSKHHLVAHEPNFGGYDPFTHADVDIHCRVIWWTTRKHPEVHKALLAAYHNARRMPVFYDSDGESYRAPGLQEELRKNLWAAFTAGGHAQFIYSKGDVADLRGYIKHLMTFMDSVNWVKMEHHDDWVDCGYCLARPDEYVVYLPDGGKTCVSLTDSRNMLNSKWLNPRSGEYQDGPTIKGGTKAVFTAPFDGDAVLHIFGEMNN